MVTLQQQKLLGLLSKNESLHLRELARLVGLNPNSAFRFLNKLEREGIVLSERLGGLRRFSIACGEQAALALAQFQVEKYLELPEVRREAIGEFLSALPEQPVFVVLFGSTAKGGAHQDSDIDILLVFNKSGVDTARAAEKAEARTGITISPIQCSYREFLTELKTKEDKVIASAANTGIPLSNHLSYNLLMLSSR